MDSVPTYDLWLREMADTSHLERRRFYNGGKGGVFDKIWEPGLTFFQVMCSVLKKNCFVFN